MRLRILLLGGASAIALAYVTLTMAAGGLAATAVADRRR
jgi:hypothetical protein